MMRGFAVRRVAPAALARGSLLLPAAGLAIAGSAAYYFTHPQRVVADLPEDLGPVCRSVYLKGSDAAKLHALWVTASGGSQRAIVHHHGFNAGAGVVLARRAFFQRGVLRIANADDGQPLLAWPLVRAALARGYNFLLVDARGHGRSGGRWDPSGERVAAELAGWVRWLREEQGQSRAGLWGNSFGAAVGLALAIRGGGGLDAMVLDSPVVMSKGLYSGAVRRPVYWALQPVLELLANKELAKQLETARLRVPILLIHGINDTHVPFWQSQYVYNTLHQPEAPERMELWPVPGADHLEALEVAEDAYIRRTLDWFDRWFGEAD